MTEHYAADLAHAIHEYSRRGLCVNPDLYRLPFAHSILLLFRRKRSNRVQVSNAGPFSFPWNPLHSDPSGSFIYPPLQPQSSMASQFMVRGIGLMYWLWCVRALLLDRQRRAREGRVLGGGNSPRQKAPETDRDLGNLHRVKTCVDRAMIRSDGSRGADLPMFLPRYVHLWTYTTLRPHSSSMMEWA